MNQMWGAWSEWWWEESQRCWCRARKNTQDQYEYDYSFPDAQAQAAPRRDVDNLADAMGQVNLGAYSMYHNQDGYIYSAQAAVAGASSGAAVIAHGTSAHQPQPAPQQSKGKGRAEPSAPRKSKTHKEPTKSGGNSKKPRPASTPTAYHPEEYSEDLAAQGFQPPFYKREEPEPEPGDHQSTSGADEPSESESFSTPGHATSMSVADYGTGAPQASGEEQVEEQAPLPAMDEQSSVGPREAGPFYTTLPIDAYGTGTVDSAYSTSDASSVVTTAYPYSTTGADDGRNTPTPSASYSPPAAAPSGGGSRYPPRASHYSTGTSQYSAGGSRYSVGGTRYPVVGGSQYSAPDSPPGVSVRPAQGFDESAGYVVEPSSKFQPGEIFKIMWTEPLGNGGRRSERPTQHVRLEHNGVQFYQGLRRFIVVANDQGNCTCVPILTYERQGCKKRGVKPLKHGIIHEAARRPRALPEEPRLGFDPVRVHMYEPTERLVKESRVNYAKLTTIEHNVPVLFIGSVEPDDFNSIVGPAVDACWQEKMRRRAGR